MMWKKTTAAAIAQVICLIFFLLSPELDKKF